MSAFIKCDLCVCASISVLHNHLQLLRQKLGEVDKPLLCNRAQNLGLIHRDNFSVLVFYEKDIAGQRSFSILSDFMLINERQIIDNLAHSFELKGVL